MLIESEFVGREKLACMGALSKQMGRFGLAHSSTLFRMRSESFPWTTASLSAVGYEHDLTRPVICLWNDDRHVGE